MAQQAATGSYLQVGTPASTAASITFAAERKLFFASEWEFLPEGSRIFRERFHEEIKRQRIIAFVKWDSENGMFQMRCSRENVTAVFQIFDSLLRQIIKEESGDSSEQESPLYMSDSLPGAEDEEVISDKIRRIVVGPDVASSSPDEVVEEEGEGEGEEDDHKFSRAHLSDLSSEDRNLISPSSILVGNILYSEDSSKFRVKITTFGQVGQRFFGTTLVDNMEILGTDDYYEKLAHAHTICYHSKLAQEFPSPYFNNKNSKGLSLRDWTNYTYPAFGDHTRATLAFLTKRSEAASEKQDALAPHHAVGTSSSQTSSDLGSKVKRQAICDFKLLSKQQSPKAKNISSAKKTNPFGGRLEQPELLGSLQVTPSLVRPALKVSPSMIQDPSPEFIAEVKWAFQQIVENINFSSNVSVRAELGRLFIRGLPHMIHQRDEYGLEAKEVHDLLVKSQVQFTQILTITPAEIHHLIDMKVNGKHMWKTVPSSRSVVYQFVCKDEYSEGSETFMVEVTPETKIAHVVTRLELGAVNIHGIKRLWDFRLVAYSTNTQSINQETYGGFAIAILDSLQVPSGLSKPFVQFDIPESLFHFLPLSVRVLRTTHYISHDEETVLDIREVHELDISTAVANNGATCWTAAAFLTPRSGKEWLDFWYEASISSSKPVSKLNNMSWDAKKLTNIDVAKTLCVPACHMLKQMDYIGYQNRNGIELRKATAVQQQNLTHPQKEPFVFW